MGMGSRRGKPPTPPPPPERTHERGSLKAVGLRLPNQSRRDQIDSLMRDDGVQRLTLSEPRLPAKPDSALQMGEALDVVDSFIVRSLTGLAKPKQKPRAGMGGLRGSNGQGNGQAGGARPQRQRQPNVVERDDWVERTSGSNWFQADSDNKLARKPSGTNKPETPEDLAGGFGAPPGGYFHAHAEDLSGDAMRCVDGAGRHSSL